MNGYLVHTYRLSPQGSKPHHSIALAKAVTTMVRSRLGYHGYRRGVAAKSIKMIGKMLDVRRSGFELSCDRIERDDLATSQSSRAGSRLLRRRGAASGTARRRLLFDARMVARDRSQQQEQQHQHEQQQQKQQLREQKNEADCVRPIGERDAESMPEGL